MSRIRSVAILTVALTLSPAFIAGAASQNTIEGDQASAVAIALDASDTAQASNQTGRVTVVEYRIAAHSASPKPLSVTGPTKRHHALFTFRQGVRVCMTLPRIGAAPTIVNVIAKNC
jgi:hypothetical protein